MVAKLSVQFGHQAVAGELCAAGRGAVEQALAHIVELPLCHSHQFPVACREVAVAHLRLTGVTMEGGAHIQRVGHGHYLMDDHRIPILAYGKFMTVPIQPKVGVPQAQVVDGSIGATREVAFNICHSVGSKHLWTNNLKSKAGGDGQHVGLPAVVEVVAEAVKLYRLGVEEHHVLASSHHRTAVGVVVRVNEAVPLEAEGLLGFHPC